jgi:hypothetical protein
LFVKRSAGPVDNSTPSYVGGVIPKSRNACSQIRVGSRSPVGVRAAAEHRSGCQTPWRNQPAKLAARAICARAVVGNSDRPRFAAWQEDRCGPPAAARPLLAWLAQQLRHNAGRFDRHRRPPRANDRREGALPPPLPVDGKCHYGHRCRCDGQHKFEQYRHSRN